MGSCGAPIKPTAISDGSIPRRARSPTIPHRPRGRARTASPSRRTAWSGTWPTPPARSRNSTLWFTVQQADRYGYLGTLWVALFGTNRLGHITPDGLIWYEESGTGR